MNIISLTSLPLKALEELIIQNKIPVWGGDMIKVISGRVTIERKFEKMIAEAGLPWWKKSNKNQRSK